MIIIYFRLWIVYFSTNFWFSFQLKEPEYTKVRRKGGRLRDPHSESQGKEYYKIS